MKKETLLERYEGYRDNSFQHDDPPCDLMIEYFDYVERMYDEEIGELADKFEDAEREYAACRKALGAACIKHGVSYKGGDSEIAVLPRGRFSELFSNGEEVMDMIEFFGSLWDLDYVIRYDLEDNLGKFLNHNEAVVWNNSYC